MLLKEPAGVGIHHRVMEISTSELLEFIDITQEIEEQIAEAGVHAGLMNIQTLHTTTAIILNENEPCLLHDMKTVLERIAPRHGEYRHNDFTIRTGNLPPDEPKNGDSHCKALFLSSSQTVNIQNGRLQLGTWQRVFFVELDGPRSRRIALTILGS